MQSIGGQSPSPTGSVNQPWVPTGRLQIMRNGAALLRADSQASSLYTHFLFKTNHSQSTSKNIQRSH